VPDSLQPVSRQTRS